MEQVSRLSPQPKDCCLLVEDQPITRDYLQKTLIDAFPNSEMVPVRSLKEARAWLDESQVLTDAPLIKLALIDLGLPDGCGTEIVRQLAKNYPAVPSVVITIYDDDAHLLGALEAGAYGYILKDDDSVSLIDLLRRIERGEPPLSPSIAHRLIAYFRNPSHAAGNADILTSRERETLTLIARGHTVPEAAERMGLSAKTVAGYVKVIYQKLHVSNRAQATREAMRRGLA